MKLRSHPPPRFDVVLDKGTADALLAARAGAAAGARAAADACASALRALKPRAGAALVVVSHVGVDDELSNPDDGEVFLPARAILSEVLAPALRDAAAADAADADGADGAAPRPPPAWIIDVRPVAGKKVLAPRAVAPRARSRI